jgi:hypothetical protein
LINLKVRPKEKETIFLVNSGAARSYHTVPLPVGPSSPRIVLLLGAAPNSWSEGRRISFPHL